MMERGFTIIEVLVTVIIFALGIYGGATLLLHTQQLEKKLSQQEKQLLEILDAIEHLVQH